MDIVRKRLEAKLEWQRKYFKQEEIVHWKDESRIKEKNNQMLGVECSTVCCRNVDINPSG